MLKLSTLVIVVSTALGAGCGGGTTSGGVYASGGYASAGYSAGVYGSTPPLVEVSPDVWVIEGYNEPVFYSDNYYWLYRDGVWLRSTYYTGGWITVTTVPYRLRTIHTPYAYVRYRAPAGARFRQGPQGRVIVRDHRDPYAEQRQREIQQNRFDARERQEQIQDNRQDARERQEQIQDNRQEARERQQDIRENRQDARERQQQIKENRQEAREQQRKRDRRNKKN